MRQSRRRMMVAARRIHNREDILQRRPVRYRWPKRRPRLVLEGFAPDEAIEFIEMLMTGAANTNECSSSATQVEQ